MDLQRASRYLSRSDINLKPVIEAVGPCTLQPHTDYYGSLVDAIISQQLSVKAGDTILRRLKALYGNSFPTPEQIIDTPDETIRSIGASRAKAGYIKSLAQHVIDGKLGLKHLATLPNETVIRQLVDVKGIGEWTAHMFMIFSLGRLDILPVGDLGIRKAIQNVYRLDRLPLASEIETIAATNGWHPYESIASWYLWRSLEL